MEDADAAVAFVRRPDIADKFGIDPRRMRPRGHSMGGFRDRSLTLELTQVFSVSF